VFVDPYEEVDTKLQQEREEEEKVKASKKVNHLRIANFPFWWFSVLIADYRANSS